MKLFESLESRRLMSTTITSTGTFSYASDVAFSTTDDRGNPVLQADDQLSVRRINDYTTFANEISGRSGIRAISIVQQGSIMGIPLYNLEPTPQEIKAFLEARLGTDQPIVFIEKTSNADVTFGDSAIIYGTNFLVARASDVRRFSLEGGIGNDSIQVANNVKVPTTLIGGSGNDTLLGGSKNDYLSGGAGNDRLTARGTGSILEGGQGNDSLTGSAAARDTLYGGAGTDTLNGGDAASATQVGEESGTTSPVGDSFANPITGRIPGGTTTTPTGGVFSGIADYLDGGEDNDSAQRDDADTRISIEFLISIN